MINGCLVRLWDLPGAGDKDVPAYRTMEALAIAFSDRKVDGLLLLSSRSDRMPLGSQLVAKMMDLSFTNEDKWASVVLVGTKNDKYDEGDEENFKIEVLAEFNKTVGGDIKKVCTCNHKDIHQVFSMIELLRKERGLGNYQQPEASCIAATLCDLNGLPEGATRDQEMAKIIEQIKEDRRQLQIALEEQIEENRRREREHREMVDSMRDDHEQQREDMTRLMEETKRDGEEREKRLRKELHQARVSQSSNGGLTIDLGGLFGGLFGKPVSRGNFGNHSLGAPHGAPHGAPYGAPYGAAGGQGQGGPLDMLAGGMGASAPLNGSAGAAQGAVSGKGQGGPLDVLGAAMAPLNSLGGMGALAPVAGAGVGAMAPVLGKGMSALSDMAGNGKGALAAGMGALSGAASSMGEGKGKSGFQG